MSRVFLASRNRKKIVEMQRLLREHAPDIEVLGIDDVEGYDEPVEDQPTFAGNALLKARAGVAATGMPSLADDSGLCVDALNGMPGVLSARWSGDAAGKDAAGKDAAGKDAAGKDAAGKDAAGKDSAGKDPADKDPADKDRANNRLLLAQLRDVPDERRGAHFACAVAFCLPDGTERVVEGRMSGRVIREMRGEGGFGYDVLFVADEHADPADPGAGLTSAQLTPADKDAISHRGRALREIAPAVAAALAG